jgi:hypothetical protein
MLIYPVSVPLTALSLIAKSLLGFGGHLRHSGKIATLPPQISGSKSAIVAENKWSAAAAAATNRRFKFTDDK